jgi:alpha-1,2-mannosyltransferase
VISRASRRFSTTDVRAVRTFAIVVGSVLLAGSVAGYVVMVHAVPGPLWTLPDTTVYRDAGLALRSHPGGLYTAKFGNPPLDYLYTPFAALSFAAAAPLALDVWKYGLTALGIALVAGVCYACLGIARVKAGSGGRFAAALMLGAAALWLEPVQRTLSFGQINLILLGLVVFDLRLADQRPWKGIGIGLAAGIKLTPLIFVPYLFFSGRRRAALAALLAFAATVGAGFAVAPADSSAYWIHGKLLRSDVITSVLVNQSLLGFAQRITHGGTFAHPIYAALALVVGAAGSAVAVIAARRGDELLGLLVCGVTGLLVSPVSWTHHWVYTVPALVLLFPRREAVWLRSTRARIGFGAAVITLFAAWPVRLRMSGGWSSSVPWSDGGLLRFQAHNGGTELHWNAAEQFLGDYYVLAGMLLIACVGVALAFPLARRSRGTETAEAVEYHPAAWQSAHQSTTSPTTG